MYNGYYGVLFMKFKNLAKNTIIFVILSALLALSVFGAFAVPDEETTPVVTEAVTIAETEPITEAPVVEETEAETEPEPETQEETEPVTEKPTEAVTEQATQPASSQTTYASTQAVTYSLPKATVETAPTAITPDIETKPSDLTYGYVSWACVIIGVLVVVIVLISNKTQYHRGNGKHRYNEGNKITGQKRLLNDDYYNHRKTESYFNKDTRK